MPLLIRRLQNLLASSVRQKTDFVKRRQILQDVTELKGKSSIILFLIAQS